VPRRRPECGGDPIRDLARAIRRLTGRDATVEEQRRFEQYLATLLAWNRVHRMTGLESPAEIVKEIFQHSLLFLRLLPPGPLVVVDIGAGAGIPGVPLRIVRPEIRLTLIESRRKPVSFLASLKRELQLPDVEVLEGRAEDLVRECQSLVGRFDVVVSRSVGSLPKLIPTAMRYLKADGVFISSAPPAGKPRPDLPVGGLAIKWAIVSGGGPELDRSFLSIWNRGVS